MQLKTFYVIFATRSFTFSIIRSDLEQEEALEAIFNEDKAAGRLPILCIANVHSSLFQVCSLNFIYLLIQACCRGVFNILKVS